MYPKLDKNSDIIILDYLKFNDYVKNGYFLFRYKDAEEICCAITHKYNINSNKILTMKNEIFLVEESEFYNRLENSFSHLNTIQAKYCLDLKGKIYTAKNINYFFIVMYFCAIVIISTLVGPEIFLITNNIIYLLQNIFKLTLFIVSIMKPHKQQIVEFKHQNPLPIYSIFVPLYREVSKLTSIVSAMQNLNYPKDKLDVVFITESDDLITMKALKLLNLPEYIRIITVPHSMPKTKPKAMNYALNYIKGEYLVIYDAEDIPEPDQLLKAIKKFEMVPDCYVCLQAKLNFHNKNQNLLTWFFAIEYCTWFEFLLKGLSILELPIPLGGTSNHFKVTPLKDVGAWDAYNVTEDADLGIRLFLNGYKVSMLDSITLEESPIALNSWIFQRARWIKGFIQTFIVFLRQHNKAKSFGFKQKISIYLFVGASSYSFFILPWFIMLIFIKLNIILLVLCIATGIFSVVYLYSSAVFVLLYGKDLNNSYELDMHKSINRFSIILLPCYFLFHTIACYISLYELVFKPFYWNKTQHGIDTDFLFKTNISAKKDDI